MSAATCGVSVADHLSLDLGGAQEVEPAAREGEQQAEAGQDHERLLAREQLRLRDAGGLEIQLHRRFAHRADGESDELSQGMRGAPGGFEVHVPVRR